MSIRNGIIYIFVLYQGYYFFNPATKWWGSMIPDIRFSFYIVLLLLALVAINWPKLKQNQILKTPQLIWIWITVVLYGIASFYATLTINHSIAFDAYLTIAVLITAVFKIIQSEKHLDIAIGGYVLFSGYLGYYITQFGRSSGGRFNGAGMVDAPDSNGLAAAIAPSLLFCLYYFWRHPNWKVKAACVVFGAFITNGIVILGSRGSFLGIAIAGAFFIYFMFRSSLKVKSQKRSALFIVVAGLLSILVVTDNYFWVRMKTIKTEGTEQTVEKETGSTRIFFWKAAIEMAKDYPFGTGASGFIAHSHKYLPPDLYTGGSRNRAVHSTWFEVLSEIGYLGLFSFMMIIFFNYLTLRRTLRQLKTDGNHQAYYKVLAIAAAFLCFVIIMTFINRFRAEILYWLILFSASAYNIFVLKSKSKNSELQNSDLDQA